MKLDVWLEEVKRDAEFDIRERRQKLAHGERVRLHLQLVVFGRGAHCGVDARRAIRRLLVEVEGKLRLLRQLWLRRRVRSFSRNDAVGFEVEDLDVIARDEQLVDHAEENSQRPAQTKTHFTPETRFTRWLVGFRRLRRG